MVALTKADYKHCLNHAKDSTFLMFREEFLAICNRNKSAAVVLAIMEHQTNLALGRNGSEWIKISQQDICDQSFNLFNRKTINGALQKLRDWGFLLSRNSERSLDHTQEHRLNLSVIQERIDAWKPQRRKGTKVTIGGVKQDARMGSPSAQVEHIEYSILDNQILDDLVLKGDHDQVDNPIPPQTEHIVDDGKMVKVESDTNPPQNRQPKVVDTLKEEINTPLPSSAAPSPVIAPGVIRVVVQADLQQQQHLMKQRTHNSIKLFCKTSPAMANAVGTTAGFANKPLCMDCLVAWECTQVDEHTKNAFSKMVYGSERQRKIQEDADKMDAALLELGEAMGHAVTVEDVDRYDEWWKREDWRGRREERPTLRIVQSTWLGALASDKPVLPVPLPSQGSNPHELAAALYDDRPNPYLKNDDELPPRQIKLHKETDKEMKSWFATKGQLEVQLNQATFAMWIRPLKAIGYADPDTLVLEAANSSVAEWFHKHIEPAVKETYNRIDRRGNHKPSIKFVVVIDGDNEYRDGADMRKAAI